MLDNAIWLGYDGAEIVGLGLYVKVKCWEEWGDVCDWMGFEN
jgi:hypothetical protein